jgi:hypothetical protein
MNLDDPVPGISSSARLDEVALKAALDRHRIWLETRGADGARAKLAGICLRGLSLWRSDLRDADLERADLRGVNLDHAVLQGASLRGACLASASLWGADLSKTALTAADLRTAKLDHALLHAASLCGADLTEASLWGAHLEGADLSDAVGLVPSQLDPAFHDTATRLPPLSYAGEAEQEEKAAMADNDPVVLDEHRGMAAQKATEIRRHLAEVEAEQEALRRRQAELETFLFAAPAVTWAEAAEKARYLIGLLATTSLGQDPRRQKIIASVLDDFRRLSAEPAKPATPE